MRFEIERESSLSSPVGWKVGMHSEAGIIEDAA